MLSPWLQPSVLNSPLQAAGYFGYGGSREEKSLDKRDWMSGTGAAATVETSMATRDRFNEYRTVAETITNAFGNRSPYYIIGEIPKDYNIIGEDVKFSDVTKYLGRFGGAVRAVSDLITGKEQEGVIIDCLGDITGQITMELTSNPILFKSSNVTDGRLRKPNVVKAVVGVSNYNNDDIIDMAVDTISALDPTGILSDAANMLINNGNTRGQTALYKLRWLQENGQPFKVYTPHGMYENMVITSIEPTTNAGTMDMLFATITFTEIIYAQPYYSKPGDAAPVPVRENIISTNADGITSWDEDSSLWKNIGNKAASLF